MRAEIRKRLTHDNSTQDTSVDFRDHIDINGSDKGYSNHVPPYESPKVPFSKRLCIFNGYLAARRDHQPYAQLNIRVDRARHLLASDFFGTSDCFVMAYLNDSLAFQTSVRFRTTFPLWEEEFRVDIYHPESIVSLLIFDEDNLSQPDLLGFVQLPVASLGANHLVSGWFDVFSPRFMTGSTVSRQEMMSKYKKEPSEDTEKKQVDPVEYKSEDFRKFSRERLFRNRKAGKSWKQPLELAGQIKLQLSLVSHSPGAESFSDFLPPPIAQDLLEPANLDVIYLTLLEITDLVWTQHLEPMLSIIGYANSWESWLVSGSIFLICLHLHLIVPFLLLGLNIWMIANFIQSDQVEGLEDHLGGFYGAVDSYTKRVHEVANTLVEGILGLVKNPLQRVAQTKSKIAKVELGTLETIKGTFVFAGTLVSSCVTTLMIGGNIASDLIKSTVVAGRTLPLRLTASFLRRKHTAASAHQVETRKVKKEDQMFPAKVHKLLPAEVVQQLQVLQPLLLHLLASLKSLHRLVHWEDFRASMVALLCLLSLFLCSLFGSSTDYLRYLVIIGLAVYNLLNSFIFRLVSRLIAIRSRGGPMSLTGFYADVLI